MSGLIWIIKTQKIVAIATVGFNVLFLMQMDKLRTTGQRQTGNVLILAADIQCAS